MNFPHKMENNCVCSFDRIYKSRRFNFWAHLRYLLKSTENSLKRFYTKLVWQSLIIIKQISEFLDWEPIEFGWCSLEWNQTLMVHTLNLEPRFGITVKFKKNHGLTFPLLTQPLSPAIAQKTIIEHRDAVVWRDRVERLGQVRKYRWPVPKQIIIINYRYYGQQNV